MTLRFRDNAPLIVRRYMKKIIIILILVFAASSLFRYIAYRPDGDNLEKHLKEWGVGINAAGFNVTDFSQTSKGGFVKEILEAKSNLAAVGGEDVILQMTKISAAAPQKYISDKKFLLKSLFLPTTSPYPGVITNVVECPDEFKPKVQEGENGIIYTLFAGERFTYGICAEDLVAYYSAYGIFDCEEKGIFEVRVFSKEAGAQAVVRSFRCRP